MTEMDETLQARLAPAAPDAEEAAALTRLQAVLAHSPFHTGLVDVTSGDNSFAGVTGYPALPGYDLSSGWGTIDASTFVPALARL